MRRPGSHVGSPCRALWGGSALLLGTALAGTVLLSTAVAAQTEDAPGVGRLAPKSTAAPKETRPAEAPSEPAVPEQAPDPAPETTPEASATDSDSTAAAAGEPSQVATAPEPEPAAPQPQGSGADARSAASPSAASPSAAAAGAAPSDANAPSEIDQSDAPTGISDSPFGMATDPNSKGTSPWVWWRGTNFVLDQSVTTTAVGIGRNNLSDSHEVYSHGYSLLLNAYLYSTKDVSVRVASRLGYDVELSNSDTTNRQREMLFRDPSLSLAGRRTVELFGKHARTAFFANFTVLAPASANSRHRGIYLVSSPRLSVIPPLGVTSSDVWFDSIAVGLSARWDHTFSRATEAVSGQLSRPRTAANSNSAMSDQLGGSFTQDLVNGGAFAYGVKHFDGPEFYWAVSYTTSRLATGGFTESECDVVIDTGCVQASRGDSPTNALYVSGISGGLTFMASPLYGISLGYSNVTNQLAPDGSRRSPFYSPQASFSSTLVVALDAFYEHAAGRPRSQSFLLFIPGA